MSAIVKNVGRLRPLSKLMYTPPVRSQPKLIDRQPPQSDTISASVPLAARTLSNSHGMSQLPSSPTLYYQTPKRSKEMVEQVAKGISHALNLDSLKLEKDE